MILPTFPNKCAFCHLPSNTPLELCAPCYHSLPWLQNACYQCGAELLSPYESIRCNSCIFSPPNFDRFCALFTYDLPVKNLLPLLKFHNKLAYGKLFGQLLLKHIIHWHKAEMLPEAIIPVPLSSPRICQRGYNQVVEILRPLRKAKILPIVDNICLRHKRTKAQTIIPLTERYSNVENAFSIIGAVPYEHIAIVDDVFTTGSTMRAVCSAFRKAGVQQIDAWCICRVREIRQHNFGKHR